MKTTYQAEITKIMPSIINSIEKSSLEEFKSTYNIVEKPWTPPNKESWYSEYDTPKSFISAFENALVYAVANGDVGMISLVFTVLSDHGYVNYVTDLKRVIVNNDGFLTQFNNEGLITAVKEALELAKELSASQEKLTLDLEEKYKEVLYENEELKQTIARLQEKNTYLDRNVSDLEVKYKELEQLLNDKDEVHSALCTKYESTVSIIDHLHGHIHSGEEFTELSALGQIESERPAEGHNYS